VNAKVIPFSRKKSPPPQDSLELVYNQAVHDLYVQASQDAMTFIMTRYRASFDKAQIKQQTTAVALGAATMLEEAAQLMRNAAKRNGYPL